MEQTLAQGEGLSLRQKQFLDLVLQEKYLLDNFYLSGGTGLASWYLHHRESYDLDFFTDRSFNGDRVTEWIKRNQSILEYRHVSVDDDLGFYTYFFRYPDNSRFKVDFNHYSFNRLKPGIRWRGLEIDTLYDIAVNKIHTIRTKARERDYVDLYLIIKETNWTAADLLTSADQKFVVTTDTIKTAQSFLKAAEITNLPKMLVPFDQKAMEKFYESLARSLRPQILK